MMASLRRRNDTGKLYKGQPLKHCGATMGASLRDNPYELTLSVVDAGQPA